jgi:hypothetical protein
VVFAYLQRDKKKSHWKSSLAERAACGHEQVMEQQAEERGRKNDATTKRGTKPDVEVGFEVLTAVSTKMAVNWVVAPCSLEEVYERFGGPFCLDHQDDE